MNTKDIVFTVVGSFSTGLVIIAFVIAIFEEISRRLYNDGLDKNKKSKKDSVYKRSPAVEKYYESHKDPNQVPADIESLKEVKGTPGRRKRDFRNFEDRDNDWLAGQIKEEQRSAIAISSMMGLKIQQMNHNTYRQ